MTLTANKTTRRRYDDDPHHGATSHRGHIPILKLVLGILLVGFFLLALMLQIQTSEAFLLGGSPVQLAANWGVLSQPVELIRGQLPLDIAKAAMWGWGIELVYLVCVVGEVSVHGRLGGDFNYGNMASGFWGQVAFAAITSFIVAFFGLIGLTLIWESITEFSR